MSHRSPLVNVISSLSNLHALVFFCDLDRSVAHGHFKGEQVVVSTAPSITVSTSSFMVTFRPLSSSIVAAPPVVALSVEPCATSWDARTSSASCLFRFCCAKNLAATFYFRITVSSCPTASGLCHSSG